ncbi:IKS protein kinase [Allomyces macrogynus ATCC 38327]|uniref:non-specific serine/threonine protein kinase n=1 Tax=Allomyces macrogynus (strain ATCC 38327) TaxID=578462 RepID=A0A0L0SZ74_ALLM3|nr:IKS protein kinase [Allomyces macrogynus ATCC 38327]|eukprot:KNE67806.1 IKS protein kinase [Allomyces macrogynus ATCC 38327]
MNGTQSHGGPHQLPAQLPAEGASTTSGTPEEPDLDLDDDDDLDMTSDNLTTTTTNGAGEDTSADEEPPAPALGPFSNYQMIPATRPRPTRAPPHVLPPPRALPGLPSTDQASADHSADHANWHIILRNDASRQVVLYNADNHALALQTPAPTHAVLPPLRSWDSNDSFCCPTCHRPFGIVLPSSQDGADRRTGDSANSDGTSSSSPWIVSTTAQSQPTFLDRNYFRLLASSHTQYPSPSQPSSPTSATIPPPPPVTPSTASRGRTLSTGAVDDAVNAASFNQGYYERFFVEEKKLGRGARGSVFLCRHVLDDIPLGEYAIKKVAVGNNHPWLSRMLREVTLLERLRHPNIIAYKHAWLETARHSAFGPPIPTLFILMECARGGNLEEYLFPENVALPGIPPPPLTGEDDEGFMSPRAQALRRRRQAKALAALPKLPNAWTSVGPDGGLAVDQAGKVVRLLSTAAMLDMLLGIARGLEHLHRHSIVHRDVKPPNILLSWEGGGEVPTVLISDFGECELLSAEALRRRTGHTGTIDFTAPEMLRADATGRFTRPYSPKADVYSLGLLGYYCAYGAQLPYSQLEDVDRLRTEICAFDVTRGIFPCGPTPRVPAPIRDWIVACLAKDPANRMTAAEAVRALERLQRELVPPPDSTTTAASESGAASETEEQMGVNVTESASMTTATAPPESDAMDTDDGADRALVLTDPAPVPSIPIPVVPASALPPAPPGHQWIVVQRTRLDWVRTLLVLKLASVAMVPSEVTTTAIAVTCAGMVAFDFPAMQPAETETETTAWWPVVVGVVVHVAALAALGPMSAVWGW